jgi:hypothetical protein
MKFRISIKLIDYSNVLLYLHLPDNFFSFTYLQRLITLNYHI